MVFSSPKKNGADLWILVALTGLMLVLGLTELGDIYFWSDEGWSLVIGRFILKHGVPKAFDDTHTLCTQYGVSQNGLWSVQAWLAFYLTAAAIWVFGSSVALLRLPFVLLGVGCLPLLWCLAQKLGFPRRIKILAALFLALNVPFLLLIRNVRYYPVAVFLALWLLLLYVDFRSGKKALWPLLSLVSILLAHTYQPLYFALALALSGDVLCPWPRHREEKKRAALFFLSQVITAVFFLPWVWLVWSGMKTTFDYIAQAGIISSVPLWERVANVLY